MINGEARELMFHWWSYVDLHGIQDNLTSYQPGYSCSEKSENSLKIDKIVNGLLNLKMYKSYTQLIF
jgi:hypothetical protein